MNQASEVMLFLVFFKDKVELCEQSSIFMREIGETVMSEDVIEAVVGLLETEVLLRPFMLRTLRARRSGFSPTELLPLFPWTAIFLVFMGHIAKIKNL